MTEDPMPPFIPGLTLAERFYWQAVRPLLDSRFPSIMHGAALLGAGSEVLGYDDTTSTDHHWGPRVLLFLSPEDLESQGNAIHGMLAHELPTQFLGYTTNFTPPIDEEGVTQLLAPVDEGPVNHRVELYTVRGFVLATLNLDVDDLVEPADWLTVPEQGLLSITSGAVFHDAVGLQSARQQFAYYPHDVWLYIMAAGWARLGQEEHLMGRAGSVGDEIGAAIIAARLVRDIMRLCFLMERTYAPYPKWFGTAFKQLACASTMTPWLHNTLSASTWQEREQNLVRAYELLARKHNGLGLTRPLPEQIDWFHGRPFRVIAQHGFAKELMEQITDPAVRRIAARPPIGGLDQFSDSTDLVSYPIWRPALKRLFE